MDSAEEGLVSVIIPVFNGAKFISEALESVFSQIRIKEVIVVDDGSTDSTLDILRSYGSKIKILTQNHGGAAAARNLGVRESSGDYIAFLDADDCWMPGKIARQLREFDSDPQLGIVFGHIEEFLDSESGAVAGKVRGVMAGVSPITILVRRDKFLTVGEFSTKWSRGEFIDWYARASELGIKAKVCDEILAKRRVHGTNSGHCEPSERNDYAGVVAAALRRRRASASYELETPVVLVIFNRPELTQKIFDAVRQARPKKLFVIADGARPGVFGDSENVARARYETEKVDWPCDVKRLYAAENIGIKRSYDDGLAWVFSQVPDAIILEDDCLPSRSFFRYSAEMLEYYRNDDRVMLVSGMSLSDENELSLDHSYRFSRYSLTWGWATWARAWKAYSGNIHIADDMEERIWLGKIFQDRVAVDYWHYTFAKNARGYTHWDIAWARSCFKLGGLAIHPRTNLITNIGFGSDATHAHDKRSIFSLLPRGELSFPLKHPDFVEPDIVADLEVERKLFSGNISKLFSHVRATFKEGAGA